MEFSQLIKTRYSVRSFSDRQIENEKLEQILEAARVAPTACNRQPQRIYVVRDGGALDRLSAITKFTFGAKTVLLITADNSIAWKNPFSSHYHTGEIDASIACTQMMLQAWELGIGSCWVGYFDIAKVQQLFSIPENEQIVALLPLGYPSEDSKPAAGHDASIKMNEMVKYI